MDELSELLEMASSGDESALKTLNLDKPVKLTLDKPYANMGIIRLTGEYEATRAMIGRCGSLKALDADRKLSQQTKISAVYSKRVL